MKRISVKQMLLGAVIITLALGGFSSAQKAFAGPYDGNKCPDVTKLNYTACNGTTAQPYSCNNCKIQALTTNGHVTSVVTTQVLTCSQKTTCKNPGGAGTCSAVGNKKYDLNCDGIVDIKDYAIAVKCVGCCPTVSPSQ